MNPTQRNRWYVKISGYDSPMKIYGGTEEKVQSLFSNEKIETITPCRDFEYMQYLEKLIEQSTLIKTEHTAYGSREWYKLSIDGGYIIFRLGKDKEDGYYDIFEFQEHFAGKFMSPITFTCTNPTDFYLDYFSNKESKDVLPDKFISPKELKKTKAKLFSRKNGEKCWVDSNGYFYSSDNFSYTNKANKEEYQKFHDNPNAVLVKEWGGLYHNSYCQWWSSLSEFEKHFEKVKAETPSFSSAPKYEIKRFGYNKPHPDDRLTVYRYPYFNIDRELRHGKKPAQIALAWNQICNPKYVAYDYYVDIEIMIIEYIKWKEKQNALSK